jgi:ribosomal protein S18 acetylase RimI-like enzyme
MRDGEMVGLVETLLHPDHLWIENLAVKPQHQGNGFGRRLLAHVERRAVEHGCPEARLLTNAAFATNVALYGSIGYVVAKKEEFLGGITVHMRKTLVR